MNQNPFPFFPSRRYCSFICLCITGSLVRARKLLRFSALSCLPALQELP